MSIEVISDSEGLSDKYGYWKEHPDHPIEDWRYEVSNNDTRSGYWDWVSGKIEEEKDVKRRANQKVS